MVPFPLFLVPYHALAGRIDRFYRVEDSTTYLKGSHTNPGGRQGYARGNSGGQTGNEATDAALLGTHHRLCDQGCDTSRGTFGHAFDATAQTGPTVFWSPRAKQLAEQKLFLSVEMVHNAFVCVFHRDAGTERWTKTNRVV